MLCFFVYKNGQTPSTRYYHKNKKWIQKETCQRYQNLKKKS